MPMCLSQVIYVIEINNRGQIWKQSKTLEELKDFFSIIESSFDDHSFFPFSDSLNQNLKRNFNTEIKNQVSQSLNEIAQNEAIRESV